MAEGFVRTGAEGGQAWRQDRALAEFPLYVPTGLRYFAGPEQDDDVYFGSVPPGPRRQRRKTRKGRGPCPLRRYGGRTAPIPDSYIINATCSSARPPYPSYMFDFFLDYPTLSGTRLCHYGKNFVQNGVFLRALRARVGGYACFPQALCKKDNNFCEGMEEEGLDSEGNRYATRRDLWLVETGTDHMRQRWYQKGVNYWSGVEASVDGVLGGYGNVSGQDIVDSNKFLLSCFKTLIPDHRDQKLVALDCGAGVGRVTKYLLVYHFDEIDLVEPVEQLLNSARDNLHFDFDGSGLKNINYYHNSLQDFTPPAERYDVVWIQWCIGHLTDEDAVAFLYRAKDGLKPGGFIVLKENIAKSGFVLDKVDSSVTRSDEYFRDIFRQAELHVYKHRLQTAFPRELFMVHMYCLTTESKKKKRKKKKVKPVKRVNKRGAIKSGERLVSSEGPVDPQVKSLWGWGWGSAFSKKNEGALRKGRQPVPHTARPIDLAGCGESAWKTSEYAT
ncbi:unnamed protein product [Calypogeia fissa]